MPEHINAWIDEERLLIGDVIEQRLESAIKKESDYLLLFIDHASVASRWVEKEIEWILEQERTLDRIFLLPIVIDSKAWENLQPATLRTRKYLKLEDYTETGAKNLAQRITSELFALICRDMHSLRNPATSTKASVIERTDQILIQIATAIRQIVFNHRQANPISVKELIFSLSDKAELNYNREDFEALMRKIVQNDLIPGLVFDGFELYVQEEHYKWKGSIAQSAKQTIARAAAARIKTGHKIALDAGSTTDELARILCARITNKSLFNLSVVTTSISAANIFIKTATKLGYGDENSGLKLFVTGGRVRTNTLAIVDENHDQPLNLSEILKSLGEVDFSFVGVNGIHPSNGLTTHSNVETKNKQCLMEHARKRIILGDSSKLGIIEEACFATFNDDIILFMDQPATANPMFDTLLACHSDKVVVIK